MNCLDCSLDDRTVPAVGVCSDCGAAVCSDHASIRLHHLTRVVPLNRLVLVEPPARVVRCLVCAAPHDAARADPAKRHTRRAPRKAR